MVFYMFIYDLSFGSLIGFFPLIVHLLLLQMTVSMEVEVGSSQAILGSVDMSGICRCRV